MALRAEDGKWRKEKGKAMWVNKGKTVEEDAEMEEGDSAVCI
jgi:hypothetical protein